MGQIQNALFSFSFFCCTAVLVLIMIGIYVSSFDHMGGMKPPEGFPTFPHPDWPPVDRSGSLVPVKAFATIMISVIGVFAFALPALLIGSKRNTKQPFVPRLVGVEGFMNAGTVETYLWGSNHGNLRDVSLQSYSDTVSTPSEILPAHQADGSFSFTLIDTHLLTVTHLQCDTPPLAMFVCGQEREMHRAMLCSYDPKAQTYHRQANLRTSRRQLEGMRLMDQVSVSLAPHPTTPGVAGSPPPDGLQPDISNTSNQGSQSPVMDRPGRWKTELLFLVICLVSTLPPLVYDFNCYSHVGDLPLFK